MATQIFSTIDEIKSVIKINSTLEFAVISPYINDAKDIYLSRYIGDDLIIQLEAGKYSSLLPYVRRTLGPLTLMLATPELGIMIGDSGITVQNDQGKRSPANEAKITAAVESFRFRGFQAMERLLSYLTANSENYPEWKNSRYARVSNNCFIKNATSFQDDGMVNIDYSIITFHLMLPSIQALQDRNVRELVTSKYYETLIENDNPTVKENILIALIIKYLANKTAELYTSQTTKKQIASSGTPEFTPIIRPIYQDAIDNGNFFADQANYYSGQIKSYISSNAEELGITVAPSALNFNAKGKKIFTSL